MLDKTRQIIREKEAKPGEGSRGERAKEWGRRERDGHRERGKEKRDGINERGMEERWHKRGESKK